MAEDKKLVEAITSMDVDFAQCTQMYARKQSLCHIQALRDV